MDQSSQLVRACQKLRVYAKRFPVEPFGINASLLRANIAKDYGNIVCSLELHDCDGIAFLKAIHKKCYQFCCLGKTVSLSILDLTEFVESSEFVCKNYHASICDLIKMQGISSLQPSTGIGLMKLLVDSVTQK